MSKIPSRSGTFFSEVSLFGFLKNPEFYADFRSEGIFCKAAPKKR
jgi:hypothetical protein